MCIFSLLGKVISFIPSSPIKFLPFPYSFCTFIFFPLFSYIAVPFHLFIYSPSIFFPFSLKEFREASLYICCYRSAMERTMLFQRFQHDLHTVGGQENKYIHCFWYYRRCRRTFVCYQAFNLMIMLSCTESNIFCKCKENIHQTGFCIQDAIRSVSNRRTMFEHLYC